MTWPERHDLIINGIDFDAMLERARNEIFQKIDKMFYVNHVYQVYKETGHLINQNA